MRHAVLFAFASLLLVTSGCKSHCRLLSEKLCDCTTTSTEKTACLSRAATQEGTFPPTASDELTCEALVASCDCRLVDTPAGKERCGLAVSADAGH
jgi:hypothetical protein